MSRTLKISTCAAIAIFGVLACAPGANADHAFRRAVFYGDLNLSSNAGVNTLARRIMSAADQVCGHVEARELRRSRQIMECKAKAITEAVAAVGVPELNARLIPQRRGLFASR